MANGKAKTQLEMMTAADNILAAVQDDAPQKMLKFKQGEYTISGKQASLTAKYLAHVNVWEKEWAKFENGQLVERKTYRTDKAERPAERNDLDDLELAGSKKTDGMSADPWVFQYRLSLTNTYTNETVTFVSGTVGGKAAVSDLSVEWANRVRSGHYGLPIITLAVENMKTKNGGVTLRPAFKVTSWQEDSETSPRRRYRLPTT
jgi:hypothetical protein